MKAEANILHKMHAVPGRDHIQGRIDAPITLIEYGDFECSYCGEAYSLVKTVQERLGDDLCFVFRNFPQVNSHPHAQHAGEAAEAAGVQGKYWEMHDLLFQHQDALSDDDLCRYARSLGLNAARIMREVFSGVHTPRLKEDMESGTGAGVTGTPTFFINGKRYDASLGLYELLAKTPAHV
jgi:formate-nitrite transporter family protein